MPAPCPPELADRIALLAARAREVTLGVADLSGGTFTISNPGSIGPVVRAEAILNPPQVALLGLTAVKRTPVVVHDDEAAPGVAPERVEIRPILLLSLTFDHRAIDGGPAIRFLTDVARRLEHWTAGDYLSTPPVPAPPATTDTT